MRVRPQLRLPMSTPLLSVVVIAYNMRREIPRTLVALSPSYQQGVCSEDYEILVVENGSTQRLQPSTIAASGPNVRYRYLEHPPPSPAYAINTAVARSRGRYLCLMVDGAHLLTPGALGWALRAFRAFDAPLVMTPAFFLGPGEQNITVFEGYNQEVEDGLLAGIGWPQHGYRLFEIGCPYRMVVNGKEPRLFWFTKLFESNCLFLTRSCFEAVGGCDERFDIPGGGFLLPDLCRRVADLPDVELVQLLGEGSFHQVHGGVTTNTTRDDKLAKAERYRQQYREIRGEDYAVSRKPVYFLGHMPNRKARQLMRR